MAEAAIIIPHYNDVARLERCLASLKKNDLNGVEIVVVDNNSTQTLDAMRAKFPEIRIIVEKERGAAAARNRGVREAVAPLLLFIDADCVATPDWVRTARQLAPLADVIGGRVDLFDETPPPRSGAEGFEAVFAFNLRKYVEVQGFAVTANMVISRDVFEDVGGFRGGVSEDLDWSRRAVSLGYKLIYRDDLVVSHPSRSDWVSLKRKWHRLTQELCATNGEDARARFRWALRALAMPASAIIHLPRVLFSPHLHGVGERARAATTLFRLRLLRMFWMLRQAAGRPI